MAGEKMRAPEGRGGPGVVRFTGNMATNHALTPTDEVRRLRTVLDTLLTREDTTATLVDFAWTEHGFTMTVCCPNGNDVEARVARAVAEGLSGRYNMLPGLLVQAGREALSRAAYGKWMARAEVLAAAVDQPAREEAPPMRAEDVAALNAEQRRDDRHPYTCPNRGEGHEDEGRLVATPTQWVCPSCDYTQRYHR